jgi:hypothetical protein
VKNQKDLELYQSYKHKYRRQCVDYCLKNGLKLVPGTAAISRRRQSIKPHVAVKSICDRSAADYDSWRRRR